MLFGSVVDRWDEEAAAADDPYKQVEAFEPGASLAFPQLSADASIDGLADAVRAQMRDPRAFYAQPRSGAAANEHGGWLTFDSAVRTEDAENNIARAFIQESERRTDAVLVIPHWNAPSDTYIQLGAKLHRLGYSTAVLTLPYHDQRRRTASGIADYFVSANLGRTIRSVKQAVGDAVGVVDWLEDRGHCRVHVIGASLGSCAAGLLGAVDARIKSTVLLLTAGHFADVVWTGRATRHIAAALQGAIALDQLRDIWSIISLDGFREFYVRPAHKMLIVSGARDAVVLPRLTASFVARLKEVAAPVRHTVLPCGHYSIGMLPFNMMAAAKVLMFLRQASHG